MLADSGYQGLNKLHEKSKKPPKKPKKGQLTKEDKRAESSRVGASWLKTSSAV
jgi:hypothetical protein